MLSSGGVPSEIMISPCFKVIHIKQTVKYSIVLRNNARVVYKGVNKNNTNTIFCSDCLPLFEVKLANEVYPRP